MLRNAFILGYSVLLISGFAASACSNVADDCHETSNCGARSGSASGGAEATGGSVTGGSSSGRTSGGSSSDGGGGGEGGAEAGAGGAPVALPCDGKCMGDTPVCKKSTDTCVQCLTPSDCTVGAETKCDTASNSCVECLMATDCDSPAASKCSAGSCIKCSVNDDCDHVVGKGVCNTAAGECVQCTVADETACAGKSCNPATKACTSTTTGSVGSCESCLADSECLGGNKADPDVRCVPMTFNGTPRPGGFCLRREVKICAKPFATPIPAVSLSGSASETYCGIDQDKVRCEAVLDLGAECADGLDSSCGCSRDQEGSCTETGAGGLCRKVGTFTNRCTYSCGTPDECTGSLKCTVDDPYCH